MTYAGVAWAWYGAIRADRKHWQRTTAARRTEADVRAHHAKIRAANDLTTCLAIWQATTHDIPQQTRRTEEDQ